MILLVKLVISTFGGMAGLFLFYCSLHDSIPPRIFLRVVFICFVVLRIVLFISAFALNRIEPQSDVTVYYREAVAVSHGSIPLADIHTAYGPLFDYINAGFILIWASPLVLILWAMIVECAAFFVWLHVAQKLFTEPEARQATALYVCNPIPITSVVIGGQNHITLALALGLAATLLTYGKERSSGFVLGMSIITVSFFTALFAPILCVTARRRITWAVSFSLPVLIAYGLIHFMGGSLWSQIAFHAHDSSSGNLPFLLSVVGVEFDDPQQRFIANLAALGVLVTGFLVALARFGVRDKRAPVLLCAFVLLITLIVNKKAFASYLLVGLMPICLVVVRQKRPWAAAVVLQAVCGVGALEPSLWFRWLHQGELSLLFYQVLPLGVTRFEVFIFLVCDAWLVGGYLLLACFSWRALGWGHSQIKHGAVG